MRAARFDLQQRMTDDPSANMSYCLRVDSNFDMTKEQLSVRAERFASLITFLESLSK